MTTPARAPLCVGCTHLRQGDTFSCDAFPDGIPEDITFSRTDHRQPVKGDHGIQFVALTPKDARYAAELFND